MSIETMGMWSRCSTSLRLVMSIVTRRIQKVEECKIAVKCAGLPMLTALGRSKSPEKAPRGGRKSWGGWMWKERGMVGFNLRLERIESLEAQHATSVRGLAAWAVGFRNRKWGEV